MSSPPSSASTAATAPVESFGPSFAEELEELAQEIETSDELRLDERLRVSASMRTPPPGAPFLV